MKGKFIFLSVLLIFLVVTVGQTLLFAGVTGKIIGEVTDSQTGEPLAGANILLEGTLMGAATDFGGSYLILNVPPGVYTLAITMMGYQEVRIEGVRVRIDLTTTYDATLSSTILEGETVTISAERELIKKDMTGSLSAIGADEIKDLPVQDIGDILEINAGVVEDGGQFHIRGGRSGEVAFWIDGVAATDVYNGNIGITVENNSVEELQVVSGTFNAEYGQAMSGIVNIITKEGGKKYSGQLKTYAGDYVSSGDEFSLYKSVETEQDPVTGLTNVVSSERDNPLEGFNPMYNAEFSLSGPVPFSNEKLSFFTNVRYFSNDGYIYGRKWFKPSGVPGDNSLVPLNPFERITAQGKLTYKMNSNMKISYNLFWNKSTNRRNYFYSMGGDFSVNFAQHDYKYNPDGLPQSFSNGLSHIISLNHLLSPSTFYELRINRYYSDYKQYVYEDPYSGLDYLVHVLEDTTLGIVESTFDPTTDEGEAELNRINSLRGQYEWVADPDGPDGYVHPNWVNQPAAFSFMNRGMELGHYDRSTSYWVAKWDLTSQLNKMHQLKAGAEARLHELELHSYQIIPKTENGTEITPFQPDIPEIGNINRNDYLREPREISAYIQDKMELNDIIMNIGLRFDYFDANSIIPTDPSDPNIYGPFKNENVYENWVPMPGNYNGTMAQYIEEKLAAGEIREYTSDERRAFMHKKVDTKMALSPRLGIAYPITDRGVIHFSYGHFFQIPEFRYLYRNPDFKLVSGSGTTIFGNPDLEPQKTVMYEIGLQQQLTDNIGIDVTLFYRDVRDWVGTSPIIETAKTAVRYTQYENKDYENVRGITFKFEKRYANHFSARLDYTYQIAEGTYSNPNDAFNAEQNNQAPIIALVPMNWDQNHTINASIVFSMANWTISMLGRYWSGRPYTPTFPVAETVGSSAVTGLRTNSTRRPAQKSVDLTINKRFQINALELGLFMNIYNLFDQRDETNVYTDTGTAEYTTNTDPSRIYYNASRISTIEDFVSQPGWYTEPRRIQVGILLGF